MQQLVSPSALPRRLWEEIAPRRGYERLLWLGGVILLVSAAVHTMVWLASGEAWGGAVSWRKPVVFGFSFGVTLPSLAWVLGQLPLARRLGWGVAIALVASSFAEVGLITMQRWRGVASHFNFATDFDSGVFAAMGIAISIFATLTVVVLAWAGLRAEGGPSRIAALSGVLLLLVAQGLGGPLIAAGSEAAIAAGAVPDQVTVGARGVGKLPHGIGIHALQVLVTLAILVEVGSLRPPAGRRAMLTGASGCTALLGWAMTQTYLGRAPLDLTLPLGLVLGVGAALLGGAFCLAAVGLRPTSGTAVAPARGADATPAVTVRG